MKKLLLIALAAVLAVAFTIPMPAMAATKKVSFYGDVRFNTYWVSKDEDYYANATGTTSGDDDSDLLYTLDGWDSRFGARFAEGPISANVEIRPTRRTESSWGFRQWWGQWDFGPAALLIGFTYTPACIAMSNGQFDSESGVYYGDFESRLRAKQIRLTVPFSMGEFVVAGVVNTGQMPDYTATAYDADNPYEHWDTDETIPNFEACLSLNFAPVTLDLYGGYARYDIVNADTDDSESVASSIYGAKVGMNFGPAYLRVQYTGSTNPANYSGGDSADLFIGNIKYGKMLFDPATGDTEDSTYKSYGATVGYKVNDMLSLEAGYFTSEVERYLQEDDTNSWYYLVAIVTPIKGVTIYPEIGVRDDEDFTNSDGVTTEQGKRTYFGAYWKISF